jgi:hypothetical protein
MLLGSGLWRERGFRLGDCRLLFGCRCTLYLLGALFAKRRLCVGKLFGFFVLRLAVGRRGG